MPEIRIPDKFKEVIRWSPEPLWDSNFNRDSARYDAALDIITLDPEFADTAVLCEELWHRKQEQIKRRLELPSFKGRMTWITTLSDELGIAPRTRDVAVRLNLEPYVHHLRYLYLLNTLIRTCYRSYREESMGYFQRLKGEKLFDGLAFIIQELYKPGYCAPDNLFWRFDTNDPNQIDSFWKQVNQARKNW